MADLKVQGVVEMSTENAGNQLDSLGNKAGAMATKMRSEADKAGSAIGKIGDGAESSADKLTRAESRMAASIRRATIDLQMLGKTASEKLQFKIDDKGLDAAKFAPALAQLKALEAQQMKTGAALAGGAIQFDKYGMSAKQTAMAMRGVPAQMTDIITSLQGGQRPLNVFLQQGGQLRDMFGGIVPAARALGAGVMSMVNPFTVAAAAIGGLAYIWHAGASEMDGFRKNAIMTGGAIGATTEQVSDMAAQMARVGDVTRSSAAAALTEVAASGKIAAGQLQSVAQIAIDSSDLLGRSTQDVVTEFAKLSEDPVKGLKELNAQYHFLTPAVYEQVAALQEQGRTQDAARLAVKAYAEETQKRLNDVRGTLDPVASAWTRVKVEAAKAWDAMFDVSRPKTTADMIRDIQGQIEKATALSSGGAADNRVLGGSWLDKSQSAVSARARALKAQIVDLQAQQDALRMISIDDAGGAAAKAAAAQAAQAKIELDDLKKKYLEEGRTREQQKSAAVASENDTWNKLSASVEAGSKEYEKLQAAHYERLKQIDKKYQDKTSADHTSFLAGLNANLIEQQQRYDELSKSFADPAKISQADKTVLDIEEKLKLATDAGTRSRLENGLAVAKQVASLSDMSDVIQKENQTRRSTVEGIEKQTQSLEDQVSTYGMGAAAIQRMIVARLEEEKVKAQTAGSAQSVIDGLQKEIDVRTKLAGVISQKDVLDANAKAAKKAADEWERANDRIGQSLTDALLRGFESGKSFAENFRDTLVNMFKTMILQPVIQPIMTGVAGTVRGALGFGASGAPGASPTDSASSAMSLANIGSSVKSLYSAITGGFAEMSSSIATYTQSAMNLLSGSGGIVGQGPMQISAFAKGMGVAGSYLAGIGAGYAVGNLISGQYAAFGNANIATLGGTAIGAIFGGPVGAAIGGAIGGVINRAFGKGPKEYGPTSVVGSFGGALGFTGSRQTPWEQSGGWFSSGDSGIHTDPLDTMTRQALGNAFDLVRTGVAALASSVGVSAQSLMSYSEQVKLALTDDAAANQKLIDDTLSGIGDRMVAALMPTIGQFAKSGETVTQTLQRLGTSLTSVNTGLALVHKGLLDVSLSGADAASRLADVFGGVDNFSQASQAFYLAAYTDGERATQALQDMRTALQAVGVAMPDTMVQLRSMALALDLTTDSGRAAYAALISLAPTFAQATATLLQQAQAAGAKLAAAFTGASGAVPAFDLTALSNQIILLRSSATGATVDFAGLNTALADVDTDTFVTAVTTAFQTLADRVKGVIGDINAERQAVRDAALQIIDPSVMTPDAIARAIGGINTVLPGNEGVVAAGAALTAADAFNAQRQQQLAAAANAYNPALASFNAASAQVPGLQAQYDDLLNVIRGKEAEIAIPRKYHEGRQYVRDLQATMPALYDQLNQIGTVLNAAKAAASPDKWNQVIALQNAYNQAVSDAAASQAAANTAAAAAKAANTAYADALQAFAIDAGNSVAKLMDLREETVKYYQAQKALADLMTAAADGLRKTATDYRLSQLDPDQQFVQMRSDFAKNYSLALSTDGETLASYADKLNSSLDPLLEKAKDAFATDAQYNSFVAQTLARANNIASRLDTLAPSTYEDDSLALLNQIDSTLAALDESSQSASAIITAAINAGRDATVNGLRQVTNALTGQPVAAFATGGDFAGGLRIVGENGPELEATGPSRIFSSVQTREILSGGGSDALVAEVRALRQEVANLNAAAMATAGNTGKIARQGDRIEIDGMVVRTESDSPILTVAA